MTKFFCGRQRRRSMVFRLALSLFVGLVAVAPSVHASDVMLSPGTVVFDDRTRSRELTVANIGESAAVFQLEPVFFAMQPDGFLAEVPIERWPANHAASLVRFSPRQFELHPGESQLVRLAVRKPGELPPGEYRIHLRVRNEGNFDGVPQVAAKNSATVEVPIRVARAVRILVRHRIEGATVRLEKLAVERDNSGRASAVIDVRRVGVGSAIGEYVVTLRETRGGRVLTEFPPRRVSLYAELDHRTVKLSLPTEPKITGRVICAVLRDAQVPKDSGHETCIVG